MTGLFWKVKSIPLGVVGMWWVFPLLSTRKDGLAKRGREKFAGKYNGSKIEKKKKSPVMRDDSGRGNQRMDMGKPAQHTIKQASKTHSPLYIVPYRPK